MSLRVPFVDLRAEYEEVRSEVDAAVSGIVERSQFILGPSVERFESAFAAYVGARHCAAVSSGTEALKLVLEALGVGDGDEVVLPAHTFAATAMAVWACRAVPRFVDCDARTHLLDLERAREAVGPRTRAIMPVHLYGSMADVQPLLDLGIPVVEDAAQAHGAARDGRRAGSIGRAGCFSFYPSKNLGAWGDAGAVVTSDAALHQRLLRLRNYGQSVKYHHDELGYNARMDGLQAAILLAKLAHLDGWNARRQLAAEFYSEHLRDDIPRPEAPGVFHLYVIQVRQRDRLREALGQAGIESGVHYPIPLHLQPCFSDLGHREGDFPRAERIARETLSLPMYPQIRDEQLAHVVEQVNRLAEPP